MKSNHEGIKIFKGHCNMIVKELNSKPEVFNLNLNINYFFFKPKIGWSLALTMIMKCFKHIYIYIKDIFK